MANEKRLIDADHLWRYARAELDKANKRHEGEPGFQAWSSGVAELICALAKDMPTVDAVEVVRCKDCEFWGGVIFGNVCRRWSAPLAGMKNCTMPDDFCSYGERREGE